MRKRILLAILLLLVSPILSAACIKCDQTTGYVCYMSIYGTFAACDSPSGAGCALWGVCDASGGSDCAPPKKCPFQRTSLSLTGDYRLASLVVVTPSGTTHTASPAAENQRASR